MSLQLTRSIRYTPRLLGIILISSLATQATSRQTIDAAVQDGSPETVEIILPEGTEFSVVTIEEISSKTSAEGDSVNFKVADDVKVNGRVVIAKDAMVKGTISRADKSGRMGKSGKLSIRIESTNSTDGQKVKLRASKGKEGDDKTGTVIALSLLVSPLFLLKHGKDAKIKPGTKLQVFTDEAVKVQTKS